MNEAMGYPRVRKPTAKDMARLAEQAEQDLKENQEAADDER